MRLSSSRKPTIDTAETLSARAADLDKRRTDIYDLLTSTQIVCDSEQAALTARIAKSDAQLASGHIKLRAILDKCYKTATDQ